MGLGPFWWFVETFGGWAFEGGAERGSVGGGVGSRVVGGGGLEGGAKRGSKGGL